MANKGGVLEELCDQNRGKGIFDVVVPVSGGKDSSTVAHKLKYQYNMRPLCVNVSHGIKGLLPLNDINLHNFIEKGFDCIRIYMNNAILQYIDKFGLINYGQPILGWLTSMTIVPLKIALLHKVPLIMYAEDGETEYGGSHQMRDNFVFTVDDINKYFLSGITYKSFIGNFSENEMYWWMPPKKEDIDELNICLTHFSNYCNWNSYDNYLYAKQYAGLQTLNKNSVGTYNNFAQTDSLLYVLHTYFMYLKFGFGRCTQDVCIDIRLGRISRNEGIELILELDEKYPKEYEEAFLDYYDMTKKEFHAVIDTFANKEILEKRDGLWRKKKDFIKEYLKKE